MTLAGLPAATAQAGMFLETTEPAPITAPSPIETPGKIITLLPIHTYRPMVTGEVSNTLSKGMASIF